MALATRPRTREPAEQRGAYRLAAPRLARLARLAVVTAGTGVAFIVAHDGTPIWQVLRLLAVAGLTVVAWRAVDHQLDRRVGRFAMAAGLLAVPIGAGIAGPHLAKSGPVLTTLAGLAALIGGVVLLVIGAATLIRAAPSWRRVPVVAALLLVTFVVTWSFGQAVASTNVPRTDVGSATPADRELVYRDVRFLSSDGVSLSGWYIPSETGAAVVLLHGAGSSRSSVLDHAVVLARHGYGVLLYDARGHGRSDGRAMDFGWYGDEDVAGAVAFLAAQRGVDDDRIAAVGMSMGGEQAIGAAAANERIQAVVAEGATNRVADDSAWHSDEFGWRGAAQERFDWLTYRLTDLLTTADPPVALRQAVRSAAPRPVLLIAAGSVADEAQAARYFRDGSPDSVKVWVAPGTGHTDALDTYPDEWEARVIAFLDRALAVGRGIAS